MKGKNVFKKDEIKRIAELIRLSCMANREQQKQIRAEMRSLGFYGFDDFGIVDMTEEKFYKLIESGRIKVSDSKTSVSPTAQHTPQTAPKVSTKMKARLEAWSGKDPYVLILGTFPGEKSLSVQAYYQDKSHNSFFKIMECLFEREKNMTDKEFLFSHHISLWDCMKEADREGSLDTSIKDYVPNEIEKFLFLHPTITTIILNGTGKTTQIFEKNFSIADLSQKYRILSLPSTSNSMAITFEEKLKSWSVVKDIINNINK